MTLPSPPRRAPGRLRRGRAALALAALAAALAGPPAAAQCLLFGDVDGSGALDGADQQALVGHLFGATAPCPDVDLRPGADAGDLAGWVGLATHSGCADGYPRPCPLQQGVCTGSAAPCVDGAWLPCDYGPDFEPVEVSLDGLDNDCDGEVDVDCPGGRAPNLWCGDTVPGTTVGRPSLEATWAACGGTGASHTGGEAFHRFMPAEAGALRVRLEAASGQDLDLVVLGGTCEPATAACRAVSATVGGVEEVLLPVAAGDPVWVVVDGYMGAADDFTLDVTCPQCSGGLVAEPVGCGASVRGTTVGAADHENTWASCGGAGPGHRGGEAAFALAPAEDGTVVVTLLGDHPDEQDLDLFLLSGDCDLAGGTCLAVGNAVGGHERLEVPVTAGVPVWAVVDGAGTAADDFTLVVSCPDCTGGLVASGLACGETLTGTTAGAADHESTWAACGGSSPDHGGGEAVHRFVPEVTASVAFALDAVDPAGTDLDLLVLGGACDFAAAACAGVGNAVGGSERVTVPATAGEPLWLVVDGVAGAAGPYTLTAACADCGAGVTVTPASCGEAVPGTTVGVADHEATWATCGGSGPELYGGEAVVRLLPDADGLLELTLAGGDPANQDLDLLVLGGGCDFAASTCLGVASNPGGWERLTVTTTAGAPVYAVVDGHHGAADEFVLEARCPDCPGGLLSSPVECGGEESGSTVGAADHEATWASCGGAGAAHTGGEQVHRFTPDLDGLLRLDLAAASPGENDLDLFVLEDGCDFATARCLAAGTAIGGVEQLEVPVRAGHPVWLVVDGRDGAADDYLLAVGCAREP